MVVDGTLPDSITAAARALRAGALVGLPTETVYGLAADAGNDAAVAQIFAAKGRPSDHPLIVHVADASGIAHFAREVPAFAQALVDAFWPGPLTLILPRLAGVATAATGGQGSVGLRCPAHPVAQALLRACASSDPALGGEPVWGVAAPSANRFGRVTCRPSWATRCWCSMAAPAPWASNRPSSTARAACPCSCALAPSRATRSPPPAACTHYQKRSCQRIPRAPQAHF